MAKRRKTLQLVVTVTVPAWASVRDVRAAVRDYLNSTSNWPLEKFDGFDHKYGDLRAKSVRNAPK